MRHCLLILALLPVLLTGAVLNYDLINPQLEMERSAAEFIRPDKADWVWTTAPGSYRLPVKTINLILPPEAENVRADYSVRTKSSLFAPTPALNTAYTDGERFLNSKPALQPREHMIYQGTGKWGEVTYARFAVFPYLYQAENQSYDYVSELSLHITYENQPGKQTQSRRVPELLRSDPSFANPEALAEWYPENRTRLYDYLVVTTPALYSAAQNLVSYRQSQGLVVSFGNIADILTTSGGSTPADKLRNYLIGQYIEAGFRYLLLIGDIDVVPIANLIPEPNGFDIVPSDFYYSDLSSNFDADNDGRLGEYDTGMDYTPEIFVGRIPWNDTSSVMEACTRIAAFGNNSAAWRNNVLMPTAILNYYNEDGNGDYERTDGATFAEYCKSTVLRNYQTTTLYEQTGLLPSIPSLLPLNDNNLNTMLNTQNWGIVNWSAHGSPQSSARKVWTSDPNSNNMPDPQELEWFPLVDTDMISNLGNQSGAVFFCASCLNGRLDYFEPCLGEVLVKEKAVAGIAATRTGWYKIGWANPGWGGLASYNYHFLENYAQNGMTTGQAHSYANWMHTQYCLFGDPIDSGGIIWPELQNIYTYILFGDPAVGYPAQTNEPAGSILVWEPVGNTGLTLVNGLSELAPFNVVYTDHLIDSYNYLNQFDAVFCLFGLGYGQNNYELLPTSFEYQYLLSYLQQGGKAYVEGMVNWNADDPLWGRFGTIAPFDHIAMIDSIRYGAFPDYQLWDYAGYNGGTQALTTSGATSQPLFWSFNQDYVSDVIAVWNQVGNSRTIGSSFNLGGVTPLAYTYPQFLSIILDTLDVWTQPPVSLQDDTISPVPLQVSAYPNPFSELLEISVKHDTPVKLEIYNCKGQLVKSLSLQTKNGTATANWDGRDNSGHTAAAGVYLLKITDGTHIGMRKTLKLR